MLNIGSLNRMFRSLKQIKTTLVQRCQALIAFLQAGFTVEPNWFLGQSLGWGMSVAFCSVIFFTNGVGSAYAADIETSEGSSAIVASVLAEGALAEGTEIAAEKIDQFAQAYLKVLELLSDREAEISAAQTNAEAIEVEQSIEQDAIKIIQDSGLSMPEYMQILELASQDNAFQDKLLGRIDETGG